MVEAVLVYIEVPRGTHRKREWRPAAGRLVTEYLSPFPSPFNYGCVRDRPGADGDPADALVLGPRREAGSELLVRVRGVVDFLDAGLEDPKLVCSGSPVGPDERRLVERFFRSYAWARRFVNRLQGKSGDTGLRGVEWS